jgi:hypothetical protein
MERGSWVEEGMLPMALTGLKPDVTVQPRRRVRKGDRSSEGVWSAVDKFFIDNRDQKQYIDDI